MSETTRSNNEAGRIPPQDLDAEKSLLGAMLISDAAFPDILEKIKHTDRSGRAHV